jgi:hypothetical protein
MLLVSSGICSLLRSCPMLCPSSPLVLMENQFVSLRMPLLSPAAAAAASGQAILPALHVHLFQPINKPADILSSQNASSAANMSNRN